MRTPFTITFNWPALAPGQQLAGTPNIPNLDVGSDFIVEGITEFGMNGTLGAGITESAKLVPAVLLDVRPNASGKSIFGGGAAPLDSVAGDGKLPHVLTQPARFNGGTAPWAQAQNLTSDVTYNLFVTLHGYLEDRAA